MTTTRYSVWTRADALRPGDTVYLKSANSAGRSDSPGARYKVVSIDPARYPGDFSFTAVRGRTTRTVSTFPDSSFLVEGLRKLTERRAEGETR